MFVASIVFLGIHYFAPMDPENSLVVQVNQIYSMIPVEIRDEGLRQSQVIRQQVQAKWAEVKLQYPWAEPAAMCGIGSLFMVLLLAAIGGAQSNKKEVEKGYMVANVMTEEEFVKQGKEYTTASLAALMQTPEWHAHVRARGGDVSAYIWQLRTNEFDSQGRGISKLPTAETETEADSRVPTSKSSVDGSVPSKETEVSSDELEYSGCGGQSAVSEVAVH